jgi:hypothetical protein
LFTPGFERNTLPYSFFASWAVSASKEGLTRGNESPLGKFLVDTGLSAAQYLSKLPFGPTAALVLMSSSAAGQTATDQLLSEKPEDIYTSGLFDTLLNYTEHAYFASIFFSLA